MLGVIVPGVLSEESLFKETKKVFFVLRPWGGKVFRLRLSVCLVCLSGLWGVVARAARHFIVCPLLAPHGSLDGKSFK